MTSSDGEMYTKQSRPVGSSDPLKATTAEREPPDDAEHEAVPSHPTERLIDPKVFAQWWDISDRTVERYLQLGLPHEKVGRRIRIKNPGAARWMSLRIISDSIRKANPRMSRHERRTRAYALYLEEFGEDGDFDLE